MAWWIQQLSTYEFQVIHHPAKKHGNANGLSRVPCKQCGRTGTEKKVEPGGAMATISGEVPQTLGGLPPKADRETLIKESRGENGGAVWALTVPPT